MDNTQNRLKEEVGFQGIDMNQQLLNEPVFQPMERLLDSNSTVTNTPQYELDQTLNAVDISRSLLKHQEQIDSQNLTEETDQKEKDAQHWQSIQNNMFNQQMNGFPNTNWNELSQQNITNGSAPVMQVPLAPNQVAQSLQQQMKQNQVVQQQAMLEAQMQNEAMQQKQYQVMVQEALQKEAMKQQQALQDAMNKQAAQQEAMKQQQALQDAMNQQAAQQAAQQEAMKQQQALQDAMNQQAAQQAAQQEALKQQQALQDAMNQQAAQQAAQQEALKQQQALQAQQDAMKQQVVQDALNQQHHVMQQTLMQSNLAPQNLDALQQQILGNPILVSQVDSTKTDESKQNPHDSVHNPFIGMEPLQNMNSTLVQDNSKTHRRTDSQSQSLVSEPTPNLALHILQQQGNLGSDLPNSPHSPFVNTNDPLLSVFSSTNQIPQSVDTQKSDPAPDQKVQIESLQKMLLDAQKEVEIYKRNLEMTQNMVLVL
jgi:hypothetical protein